MTRDQPRARRRRRRAGSPAGPPPAAAAAPATAVAPAVQAAATPPARPPRRDDAGERGLRDLAGAGPSRLGVGGALRARDVNRPTPADLAEAERELHIVRRNWTPPS